LLNPNCGEIVTICDIEAGRSRSLGHWWVCWQSATDGAKWKV